MTPDNWRLCDLTLNEAMPGAAWIAQVEAACRGRGLQITALRRDVLGILAEAGQPLGAYAIIQKLSEAQHRIVAPPTVYRTLDFLVENGFVLKIESRQTFVACGHLDHHDHHGAVFSCARCGRTVEVDSAAIDDELTTIAARLGFKSERQVIEIEGRCSACSLS
jgi:Fur family transcriptional regulator, zinc uptake regulator